MAAMEAALLQLDDEVQLRALLYSPAGDRCDITRLCTNPDECAMVLAVLKATLIEVLAALAAHQQSCRRGQGTTVTLRREGFICRAKKYVAATGWTTTDGIKAHLSKQVQQVRQLAVAAAPACCALCREMLRSSTCSTSACRRKLTSRAARSRSAATLLMAASNIQAAAAVYAAAAPFRRPTKWNRHKCTHNSHAALRAHALYQQALKIQEKLLAEDDPRLAATHSALAEVTFAYNPAHTTDRCSKALVLHQHAIQVHTACRSDGALAALSLRSLATLQFETGSITDAATTGNHALAAFRAVAGLDQPSVARMLRLQAQITYFGTEQAQAISKAQQLLDHSWQTWVSLGARWQVEAAHTACDTAIALLSLSKPDDALEVMEANALVLPMGCKADMAMRRVTGNILYRLKQYSDAVPHLRAALDARVQLTGKQGARVANDRSAWLAATVLAGCQLCSAAAQARQVGNSACWCRPRQWQNPSHLAIATVLVCNLTDAGVELHRRGMFAAAADTHGQAKRVLKCMGCLDNKVCGGCGKTACRSCGVAAQEKLAQRARMSQSSTAD